MWIPLICDILVRHLYSNFRKKFSGVKLKELIWTSATASHANAWEKILREMKSVNEEAFKHPWKIPLRFWSKSRFKTFVMIYKAIFCYELWLDGSQRCSLETKLQNCVSVDIVMTYVLIWSEVFICNDL